MKLYMVIRSGIYMQGVVGIFSTHELADKAMCNAKAKEKDDYHGFDIEKIEVDREADLPITDRKGYLNET